MPLAPYEPIPLVPLNARDPQVMSIQIMERLYTLSSHADDPSDRGPVAPDESAGGGKAVPHERIVNNVGDGVMGALRVPVRCCIQLTEFGVAHITLSRRRAWSPYRLRSLMLPCCEQCTAGQVGVLADQTLGVQHTRLG